MILLGLDLGAKRTGVAVAKEGHIFGRDTIAGWENYGELSGQLLDIAQNEKIDKAVVGVPKSVSGDAERNIIDIIKKLERDAGITFIKIDETLTSVEAGRRLSGAVGEKNDKKDDNREAAKIILEDYLAHEDSHN